MPTANLTWTNKSTNDNPTGTKIERTEGFQFGASGAPAPIEVANGDTGGLDPTLAGVGAGNYSDTTVVGDTYYAYRVSTLKGGESATSIATPLTYVYDQVNDLGYTGGSPEVSSNYAISTAPFLHVDFNRLSVAYSNDDLMSSGFDGIFRHNPLSFGLTSSSYSSVSRYRNIDHGGGVNRNSVAQVQVYGTSYFRLEAPATPKACPDGVTVFAVMSQEPKNIRMSSQSSNLPGGAHDGVHYTHNYYHMNDFTSWGETTSHTMASGSVHPGQGFDNWGAILYTHVIAYRLNNDASAFSSGTIKAQSFDGGAVIGESADLHSKSYHNNPASPDDTNNLGAALFQEPYSHDFMSPHVSHQNQFFSECLYFDSALDLGDMNKVFGYLGTKYNVPITVLGAPDLIN